MAISFDEVNDFYSIADDASLTLPDGDWCVGIWTYVSDNAGLLYQYLLSNNNYSVVNSFNLYLLEDGEVPNNGRWYLYVEDGDGTDPSPVQSTSAPGGDSTWRLIILQRDTAANQIQIWFCGPNSVPVLEGNVTDANFNAINGGIWNIARRVDGNADRYYGGIACEFFKGDFALSSDEIRQLGRGLRIYDLGHIPDVYLEMFSADATLRDVFEDNDATRQDSPTTVDHAPVRSPKLPVGLL